MNREDHNWDTCEASLWLNNCEYAYHATANAIWDADDDEVAANLRTIFEEVYTIEEGRVDTNAVDWLAIAAQERENAAYESRTTA